MRVVFTVQAEQDLEEIGDYIAIDNPSRAVSFVREIREHCATDHCFAEILTTKRRAAAGGVT